jgi:hypothetical protein
MYWIITTCKSRIYPSTDHVVTRSLSLDATASDFRVFFHSSLSLAVGRNQNAAVINVLMTTLNSKTAADELLLRKKAPANPPPAMAMMWAIRRFRPRTLGSDIDSLNRLGSTMRSMSGVESIAVEERTIQPSCPAKGLTT